MRIEHVVAVVSGGASGLGEAVCRYLLECGARGVAAFDIDPVRGAELARQLDDRFAFAQVDVSDLDAVEAAIAAVHVRFGALHVVVNAAAIAAPGKLLGRAGPLRMDAFDRAMRINLYGAVHMLRSAAAIMAENIADDGGERGVLINVASGAAWEGQVGQIAYSASKAALVGMTLPLARELGDHGIRVMTLAPGAFDTPMYTQVHPDVRAGLIAASPFPQRMGAPQEFALLVEEVIRNPMHNGRTIRIDGGLTLPSRAGGA